MVGQRSTTRAANGRAEEARNQKADADRASEKRNQRLMASHFHCFID